MKTHRYKDFLLVAACMLCLAGCNKDEDFNRVTLNFDLEVPQGMKSHIDGYTIVFDSDDTVKLNNERIALSSGKLEVEENDNGYWAVFPDTAIMNGATMKGAVQIPVVQDYELVDGKQRLNGPMAAHLADSRGTLYFKNLYAVLKAVVSTDAYDVDIYRIKVTAQNEGAGLAGKVNFDLTQPTTSDPNSAPNIEFTDIQPSVQLDFTSPVTVPAYSDINFHLVVVPFEDLDLTVEVFATKDGEAVKYTYKPTTSKTLNRSCVGKLPINLQTADIDPWADLYGDFSVSPTRKVRIAPGNLQYNLNSHTWRFAEHPYDVVEQNGDAIGKDYATYKQNSTHGGWMGLFAWGTSGWQDSPCREAYYPNTTATKGRVNGNDVYYLGGVYSNSMVNDYANADWGIYNAIENPATGNTDPAGSWRTLTISEWNYLLDTRYELFNGMQWCADIVSVNFAGGAVKGIMIYPDGIMDKPDGISADIDGWLTDDDSSPVEATLTEREYEILMEEGCAFLPAAGIRLRSRNLGATYWGYSDVDTSANVSDVNVDFMYWSSSSSASEGKASAGIYTARFNYISPSWPLSNQCNRWYGGAVRLVQDVERPTSKHIKRRKH